MQVLNRPWGAMQYRIDGPEDGVEVVFANSLGTDLRLWDPILALLPNVRAIRFDKRGHGLSDFSGAHDIFDLAEDAAALIEATARGPVIFVGLSVGGLIGQALALRRPDLVRAMVLSNTAAKMGNDAGWAARIGAIEADGMASITETVMERWFGPKFRASTDLPIWRNMFERTAARGYIGTCGVLAKADLTDEVGKLSMPIQVIVGAEDGSSPPELVKATADRIPGATFHVIPDAGHLPCVETPALWADLVTDFINKVSK